MGLYVYFSLLSCIVFNVSETLITISAVLTNSNCYCEMLNCELTSLFIFLLTLSVFYSGKAHISSPGFLIIKKKIKKQKTNECIPLLV